MDQAAEVERIVCRLWNHHGPAPATRRPRPLVALPHYRQPGVAVHMDMGSFEFPKCKYQLEALVMVDAFSLLITGNLYLTNIVPSLKGNHTSLLQTISSTAADTARIYIERAEGT